MNRKADNVACRLRQEMQGMTLRELADKLRMGTSTVRSIRDGVSHPSLETAIKLANLFDITLDDLCQVKES